MEYRTGSDANTRDGSRSVGCIRVHPAVLGSGGRLPRLDPLPGEDGGLKRLYSRRYGNASSATGPLYCPVDRKMCVDLTVFQETGRVLGVYGTSFADG